MNKINFKKKCPVCNNYILSKSRNIYIKCKNCESFVYFSDTSSEMDNKNYFNKIYKVNSEFEIDNEKQKFFKRFQVLNKLYNFIDYIIFNNKYKSLFKSIIDKKLKILEIGFGEGNRLIDFLKNGFDAYGIEISNQAAKNFKQKYKNFSNRILINSDIKKNKFDVIYCSALLEHIDNPDDFIKTYSQCLYNSAFFIIDALPVINKEKNNIDERFDINFWKPCHRIIYSSSGIINLFKKYNFKIIDWSSIDDFNYRVLSLHNKYGYNKVAELRNSLIKDGNLPELNLFKKILKEALFIKSKALYGIFLFKKEQS